MCGIIVNQAPHASRHPLVSHVHHNRVTGIMFADIGRSSTVLLYVMAMVAVIIGVDFWFFRNQFWARLTVNVGVVLVFAAFYFRFLWPR